MTPAAPRTEEATAPVTVRMPELIPNFGELDLRVCEARPHVVQQAVAERLHALVADGDVPSTCQCRLSTGTSPACSPAQRP